MRSRRQSSWSYEEKQAIIDDYQSGIPLEAISAKYNFTINQVYKFLKNTCIIKDDFQRIRTVKPENKNLQFSEILHSLASGINPITGEAFMEGILDQPDIIRALYAGSEALIKTTAHQLLASRHKSDGGEKSKPENSGAPWKKEDDDLLLESFNNGASIGQLAEDFGRSKHAIERRLERLITLSSDSEIKYYMQHRQIHP